MTDDDTGAAFRTVLQAWAEVQEIGLEPARELLKLLASMASGRDLIAQIGIRGIMKSIGRSRSTSLRAVEHLVRGGFIMRLPSKRGDGGTDAMRYGLLVENGGNVQCRK